MWHNTTRQPRHNAGATQHASATNTFPSVAAVVPLGYAHISHYCDENRQTYLAPQNPCHATHMSATAQIQPCYKCNTSQIQTNALQLRKVLHAPIWHATVCHPYPGPISHTACYETRNISQRLSSSIRSRKSLPMQGNRTPSTIECPAGPSRYTPRLESSCPHT